MLDDIQDLKKSLKGKAYEFGEEGYDLSKWADNAKLPAKYIVLPAETDDISKAIRYARSHGLGLAIRGGGHSTTGASGTNGGLLIDMRNLKSVKVDKEKNVVQVGGGATVMDVEVETIKFGLATTIGTCSTVGIAGFVSGGGIGIAMGSHALATDNLVSATVVLASGEAVEASEAENSDLFWGIRGGGSNFGVLAELKMKLFEQQKTLDIFKYIFLPEQLSQVVEAINQWLPHQKVTESVQMHFMTAGPDRKLSIVLNGTSTVTQEEGEDLGKYFRSVGPAEVFEDHQYLYSKFTTLISHDLCAIPGQKVMTGIHITKFDYETVQKAYDAWVLVHAKAPFSTVLYEFYHYGELASVPVDATAFAHRNADKIVILHVLWNNTSLTVKEALEDMLELKRVVSSSSTQEAQDSLGYVNSADPWSILNETDEYARKAFGSNYPRLQKIKFKYDPDMVWNRWFAIRPAEN